MDGSMVPYIALQYITKKLFAHARAPGPARPLASKEVDDGIWLVSFMDYDLGYIDLEEKTSQPLENPFGH